MSDFPGGAEPREAKLGAPQRRAACADHRRGLREPGKAETGESRRGSEEAADCGEFLKSSFAIGRR